MKKTNTAVKSTGKGLGIKNSKRAISGKSQAQKYPIMTCSALASLVKVFPLRENVKVFKTSQGELFSSKSVESYEIKDQKTYSLRTLKDYFLTTMAEPLQLYSFRWMNLGMMWNGLSQTLNITCRKTGKGSLSLVLENEVDEKYYLSEKMIGYIQDKHEKEHGFRVDILSSLDTSGQLRAQGDKPVIKNSRIRRLTPRECERLQGFPDDWTAEGDKGAISDSQRYKMMGNAVSVPVIKAIGKKMLEVINDLQ